MKLAGISLLLYVFCFISVGNGKKYDYCGMQQECCNMAQGNCCIQGGCYNYWVLECSAPENENNCKTVGKNVCVKIKGKRCRVQEEKLFRNYDVKYCAPAPLRKCFPYKKKICAAKETEVSKNITWMNDILVPSRTETIKHCFNLDSYNCQIVWNIENVEVPVRKIRTVTENRTECSMQTIPGQPQIIKVPEVVVTIQKICRTIPKVTCDSKQPACTSSCNPGWQSCSNYLNQPKKVQIPPCAYASGCMITGQKPCCKTIMEKECRDVPIKKTKIVTKKVPGPPIYKPVCSFKPIQVQEAYWGKETTARNKSREHCAPSTKQQCIDIPYPVNEIKQEKKSQVVNVNLPQCHFNEVDAEYCHTFREGNVVCRNTTALKAFRLHKIKCDQEGTIPQCTTVPVLTCSKSTRRGSCRMVPKMNCRNSTKCESSARCKKCEKFRTNSGFGKCQGGNCNNFISPESWNNPTQAGAFYGEFKGENHAYESQVLNHVPSISFGGKGFYGPGSVSMDGFGYNYEDAYGGSGIPVNPGFPSYTPSPEKGNGAYQPEAYPDSYPSGAYYPGMYDHGQYPHGTQQSGVEAINPPESGMYIPGKGQSGTYQPEAYQPGTYYPENYQPETYYPENYQPGTYQPGTYQPETYQPEIYQPGTYQPGTYQPGIYKPETYEPGSYQPETYQPGTYQPGAYEPGTYQPGNYQPGTYQPGTYQPGTYQPGTYQPGTYQPGTYQPGTYQPGTYDPESYPSKIY